MSDYESDLVVWSTQQADLLRRMGAGDRVNDQVDWENIAEEIESLGRSDKRELRSRLQTILVHLFKLRASPAADPRAGWRQTILRERVKAEMLLEESPSLRPTIPRVLAEELGRARTLALGELTSYGEQPNIDLSGISFTADDVLGPFTPD